MLYLTLISDPLTSWFPWKRVRLTRHLINQVASSLIPLIENLTFHRQFLLAFDLTKALIDGILNLFAANDRLNQQQQCPKILVILSPYFPLFVPRFPFCVPRFPLCIPRCILYKFRAPLSLISSKNLDSNRFL